MVWRFADVVDMSWWRFRRVAAGVSFDWNRVVRHVEISLQRGVIVTFLVCQRSKEVVRKYLDVSLREAKLSSRLIRFQHRSGTTERRHRQ